jgi:hypothetical protein
MTYVAIKESILRFGEKLDSDFDYLKFVVFLCGPTISDEKKPSSVLRKKLVQLLNAEDFEVVLGEDDGLENIRADYGSYAHENELRYIKDHCSAVILIADSVGSFCELGLFAHQHVHQSGNTDFILILNKEFENEVSYLNEGPAKAMSDFGQVYYVEFDKFNTKDLIARLRRRRSVFHSEQLPGGY